MAKLGGFIKKLTSFIGNITFKQMGDQTMVCEKTAQKASPKHSRAQMLRRALWTNLANLYRAFNGKLHPSFEKRAASASDYNECMGANFGSVPVYMTKGDARQGGTMVAGCQITRESLPSNLPDHRHKKGEGAKPPPFLIKYSKYYLLTWNLVQPVAKKLLIWLAAAIPALMLASSVWAPIFLGVAK